MAYQYESLEELRRKKALLKKDISEIEELLTFENTKESLSVLTNGFTDKMKRQASVGVYYFLTFLAVVIIHFLIWNL